MKDWAIPPGGRPATSRRGRRRRIAAGALLVAGALALAGVEGFRRLASDAVPAPAEEAGFVAPLVPATIAPAADAPRTAVPAADVLPAATGEEAAALRSGLVVPVAGIARSELRDTYTEPRGDRIHEAIDILAPRGTPVLSADGGRVLRLHESEAGGLMVYASDPSGRFILLYGHLDRYAEGLADGSPVARGQVIGYVGTTGNARGTPHLHFAVHRGTPAAWWVGVPLNPYPLLVR